MRIGIDAHSLGTQAGGNETFVRELLEGIRYIAPETDVVAYVHKQFHRKSNIASGFVTWPLRFTNSWVRVAAELPWAVHRSRASLFHVQYIAPLVNPAPFVVTVHDIVWTQHPELVPPVTRARLEMLVPRTIRKAARVFAVTDAMRTAISSYYDVPSEKIDLIQTSCDPLFRPIADEDAIAHCRHKYGIDGPYIAYVGALQPRKNLVRLAEAVKRAVDRGIDVRLVLVGRKTWLHDDMMQSIESLNLGDRLVFTGYVERRDLPAILSGAEAFAYVSVYEGYGLPVIEAMACGTPVLASTDAAIVEVAGGAAVHCDPLSVESIEESLITILTDEDERARLREEGPKRAAHFNRENMARAAINGYSRAWLESQRGHG